MDCKECTVINRCVNDGDKIGTAKYLPCHRNSFYDGQHKFCDRDNSGIVADECYFCRKSVCRNIDVCGSRRRESENL